jgi:DNA repair protein RadC
MGIREGVQRASCTPTTPGGHVEYRIPLYKLKLHRERSTVCPCIAFDQPQLAAAFFHRLIGKADREHSAALFLDVHLKPTGCTILGIGSLVSTPMPGREVFKSALVANAHSIFLAHNHPSGDPAPSLQDVRLTRTLISAGELLGIQVIDHLVVTPTGNFGSIREAMRTAEANTEAPSISNFARS